jgi:GTP cyclohydrolase II
VQVVERVPCEVTPSVHAEEYLKTKKEKLGHLFTSS